MSHEMSLHAMISTVEGAGFDVTDAAGMPLTEEHQAYFEDENLMNESAHLVFRRRATEQLRGIVADIAVGQQIFRVRGAWREVEDLRHLVEGRASEHRADRATGDSVSDVM